MFHPKTYQEALAKLKLKQNKRKPLKRKSLADKINEGLDKLYSPRKPKTARRTTLKEKTTLTPKQKRKAKEVVRWGVKLWSVKKADSEFSLWLRELRSYTCEMCGYYAAPPTREIQNSHYIGRSAYSTRYNPLNCDVLCASCHSKMEDLKQYDYRDWKLARIGEEAHNNLLALAKNLRGAKVAVYECMKLLGKLD